MKHLIALFSLLAFSSSVLANPKAYEDALEAFYKKDIQSAYIHVKKTLQQSPDFLPALLLHCEILLEIQQFKLAEGELNKALEKGVDQDLYVKLMGTALVGQLKYDEALSYAKELELSQKGERYLQLTHAEVYRIRREFAKADAIYQNLLKHNPTDTDALIGQMSIALSLDELDVARTLLLQLQKGDPGSVETTLLEGRLLLKEGDLPSAIALFQRALNLDPRDIVGLKSLANAYVSNQQLEEAEKVLQRLLEVNPRDPHALLMQSSVLTQLDKDQASYKVLTDLYNQLSNVGDGFLLDHPQVILIDAIASYRLGKWSEAERKFRNYLSLEHSYEAIYLLSDAYIQRGQHYTALSLLDEYREGITEHRELALLLAELYLSQGRLLEGADLLGELVGLYQDDDVNLMYAKAKLLRGQQSEVLQTLSKIEDKKSPKYLFLLARLAFNQGNYQVSLKLSHQLNQLEPSNVDYQLLHIRTLYGVKQYKEALARAKKLYQTEEQNIQVALAYSSLLTQAEQYDQAETVLSGIDKEQGSNYKVWLFLADVLHKSGRTLDAIELLSEYESQDKFETRFRIAQLHYGLGNYRECLTLLEKLEYRLALQPEFLVLKSKALLSHNRVDDALKTLDKLRSLWREEPDQLVQLSRLYLQAQAPSKAKESLQRALQLDKEHLRALVQLFHLETSLKQYEPAQALLKQLSQLKLEPSQLLALEAELALAKGEQQLAVDKLKRSLTLKPANTAAFMQLTKLAHQQVETQGYIQFSEQLLRQSPELSFYRQELANLLLLQGAYEAAQGHYLQLLEYPLPVTKRAFALNNLAQTYLLIGEYENAIRYAKQAQGYAPNHPALFDTHGWALVLSGQSALGLSQLREATARDSGNSEYQFHLAFALAKEGRLNEASALFKELQAGGDLPQDDNAISELQSLLSQ